THGAAGLLNLLKQGAGKRAVLDDVVIVVGPSRQAEIAQGLGIADVYDAEPRVLTDTEADFAVRALEAHDMKLPTPGGVEDATEDVFEKRLRLCRFPELLHVREEAVEKAGSAYDKTVLASKERAETRDALSPAGDEL